MAKKITVLVDSSCGLDQKQAEARGLAFQSLQIVHNTNEVLRDGVDVTSQQLYEFIARGDSLKTSQSPIGENLKIVEKLLKTNDRVFCVPVSSGLSGAFSTWKALEQEVPAGRLQVVDAKSIATGMVDLAEKIKTWSESNKSDEQIHELVAKNAANTYGLLICNDFARLVKGGRLSAFKGAVASLLKLYVLIEFKDGKLLFKDKSRSVDKLIGQLRPTVYERLAITSDNQLESLSLLHTFPEKSKGRLDEIQQQLKNAFPAEANWQLAQMPAVVTCHVGLNSFAVLAVKKSS